MPVATLTRRRSVTSGHASRCSPRAMMLTSLSTSTGTSKYAPSIPGTSASSQPGMIGGLFGCPVAYSTGPGRPRPTPARSAVSRPAVASSLRPVSATPSRTGPGPSAMARGASSSASTVDARSVTARRACVAPRSTPSTTCEAGLKANVAGGRPPLEVASPAGAIRPVAMRASMRPVTVDRAWPVIVASSARVRGRPSRSSWNISPAPGVRGVTPPSVIPVVNHDRITPIFCLTRDRSAA